MALPDIAVFAFVFVVRLRLSMFVAVRATEIREVAIAVAFPAGVPLVSVGAGIDREKRAMIKRRCPIGRRMAVVASRRILIGFVVRIG